MILIIAAAPLETTILRQHIDGCQTITCGSSQLFTGKLQGQHIILGHSGIGQINMALQLSRFLSTYSPQAIFLCGCGGSYPDSLLKNGDLALANNEIFGDLGVATADKFIPLEQLRLPQEQSLAPIVQQQYALDHDLLNWAQKILPTTPCGTFVTINCCSGSPALSDELQQRTGGICENMEGAAAAQVCAELNVPLLELRGISNPTGSRNPQQWDIAGGADAAQAGILKLLANWPPQ